MNLVKGFLKLAQRSMSWPGKHALHMYIKQTCAVWYLLGPSLQCACQQILRLLFAVLVSLLTLSYSEHRRLLQWANEDGTSMCNSTSVHVIPSTKKGNGGTLKKVGSQAQAKRWPRPGQAKCKKPAPTISHAF